MDPKVDDAYEPTATEVDQDRQLAVGTAIATLTGAATIAGIYPGAAATVAAPVALAISLAAVRKLGRRRAENAADTILDGAKAAGLPVEEFLERAVAHERDHELLARTLVIAQDTALRDKRRALGRALASGVMGDEATIDAELLFLRAIADIDVMHIRLLARLGSEPRALGWSDAEIIHADPGLFGVTQRLLPTLELHGLVFVRQPGGFYRGPGAEPERYEITGAGRVCLARLAEDAD